MTNRMVGVASLVGMLSALWAVFLYAPTEATMGIVQRIFYFHVSAALMVTSLLRCFRFEHRFLLKRDLAWDRVARCSAKSACCLRASTSRRASSGEADLGNMVSPGMRG